MEDINVSTWLTELDLEQYVDAFGEADVDFETLAELTSADLRELGVSSIGIRRRLESAIARLREERSLSAPDSAGAEARRHLTILFCDVVGSTALSQRHDAEAISNMFKEVFAVLARVIQRSQGHEANRLGDGALIYFGYPQAQEHAALQAALTGCELVEEIQRLVRDPDGDPVLVRVGIASGMVVVNRSDTKSVFGETPNVAARVQSLAQPGEVLVAESTQRLLRGLVTLEPRGSHSLRGINEPMELWRVLPEVNQRSVIATRPPTSPIVGRDAQLGQLDHLWNSIGHGRGHTVCVHGEAGIGKSYLTSVFAQRVVGLGGRDRRFNCSSEHVGLPFAPFLREARDSSGTNDLLNRELTEALEEPELRESLSLIRRRREALIEGFVRRASARDSGAPVLLRFEDAHWSDPSSLEVLARIVDEVKHLPILLLITTREPNGVPGITCDTTMRLEPLNALEARSVVTTTVGALDVAASEEVIDEIVARCDGVPFYATELALSFAQAKLAGPDIASSAEVPATLQEALQYRIDALEVGADVLQFAAVIGREVPRDVLGELVGDERTLGVALHELEEAGLLDRADATNAALPSTLVFRHQMVVEYVYDTILRRESAVLHGRVADALAHRPDSEPQTRAYHEERAGRVEAAARCWAQAGRRASSRSADAEAAAYFRRALLHLSNFDDDLVAEEFEVDVLLAFLPTLLSSEGYVRAARTSVNRVVELTTKRAEPERAFNALFLRWLDQLSSGDVDVAHDFAQEVQLLADQIGTDIAPLLMDRMMGTTLMFRGELARARDALDRFAERYDADDHAAALSEYGATDNYTTVQCCRICVAALMGDLEGSHRLQGATIDEAEALGRVHNLCHALAYGGAFGSALEQEWEAMTRFVSRLDEVATEYNLPFWLAVVDLFRGIESVRSDENRGKELFERGMDWFGTHGAGFLLPSFRVLFASAAEPRMSELSNLELLDEGLNGGERWVRAELWRLRASEELRRGDTASGLEFLRRSINLAEEQGAQLLVERASSMLRHGSD